MLEALQFSLQALGPAHGKRNSRHGVFPKSKTPARVRTGVINNTAIVGKLYGKCKLGDIRITPIFSSRFCQGG